MTTDHRTFAPDAILRDAVALLHAEASDLMVAHADGCLVGVLSECDLIRALLPDRAEVAAAGGSVEDAFDAFVRKDEELRTRPIAPSGSTSARTAEQHGTPTFQGAPSGAPLT